MNYMNDCIHLKACRRMSKRIIKIIGLKISRGCNEECTAYQSGNVGLYCSVENAFHVAISGYDGPCDPFDVYTPSDFDCLTLSEVIKECEDE